MTEREFCYWLQGLFEVGKPASLTAEQTEMIRKHLALVFTNVTANPYLGPTRAAAMALPPKSLPEGMTIGDWIKRAEDARRATLPNVIAIC